MKRTFRGITAISSLLLTTAFTAFIPMYANAGFINQALNLKTSVVVAGEDDKNVDSEYYKTGFGADVHSKQAALKVETAAASEAVLQAEEGCVLLKNEHNALPIRSGEKVTLFGNGYYNARYGKLKEISTVESIPMATLPSALKTAIGENNVSTPLDSVYSKLKRTDDSTVYEAPIADVIAKESAWQTDYNDIAIVTLTRWGAESRDTYFLDTASGERYLGLQPNERDLLNYLKTQKANGVFKKIVVLINADQMMELNWLDTYDVDSCMIVGIPGTQGFTGIANVLAGIVSPSGKTVDTYASNSMSAPATVYGARSIIEQRWTNYADVNAALPIDSKDNGGQAVNYYTIYAEGIYVGYKYYETRYADCVMGSGYASSTAGSSTASKWNYTDEMCYTFGSGLSYTTFDQKIDSVTYNAETDTYDLTVTVTNTGNYAGKSVVEVYAQTPYGDYEKQNNIEKSAIQVVGFGKTKTLEKGAKETITVSCDRYLLASYDAKIEKGYILSEGDYYLAIGDNAHDALNNVLAAQGYTTGNGMDYNGNKDKTYKFKNAFDAQAYKQSKYSNETMDVTNQFDYADLNHYGVNFTYLSRKDWAGTYPTTKISIAATQQMIHDLSSNWYETPGNAPKVSDFKQGENNGIPFVAMKDVEWNDKMWETFIDQLTIEDMLSTLSDHIGKDAIESINMPATINSDDNANINAVLLATGKSGLSWSSEVMSARTWNTERFEGKARLMGVEAVFSGVNYVNYGAGNIHRTPFSGRNSYYYSEDGNFGYYMGAAQAKAMQSVGVIYAAKHFALNDCETMRESVASFATEQTIRESSLRAFEGAFTKGGALGVMCGFNRIGCRYNLTNEHLITNVLKGEWGFKGSSCGDAWTEQSFQGHYLEELHAGLDYDTWNSKDYAAAVKAAIAGGDGYMLQCLRLAAKHNIYAATRSIAVNGLTSNTKVIKITPWWQPAMLGTILALAGITAACGVVYAVLPEKKEKEEK